MKAETVVDLFQFIKAARTQRKGLVSNEVRPIDQIGNSCLLGPPSHMCALVNSICLLSIMQDQYEFCHHVLADFLDGFDTYANFKEII
ncbi:MAG: hypothetical protein A6F71_10315 [Cycloclasticus sp. symbiont of Poecilosclerida sp. M]|nr:MAG: hypothetical protein A6F71_10315 [Cycloclasticus sp. symbiont of Poecilosclerida sp. M]